MLTLAFEHKGFPAGTEVESMELYPPASHAGRPSWYRRVRLPDGQVMTLPDAWFEQTQTKGNAE